MMRKAEDDEKDKINRDEEEEMMRKGSSGGFKRNIEAIPRRKKVGKDWRHEEDDTPISTTSQSQVVREPKPTTYFELFRKIQWYDKRHIGLIGFKHRHR